MEKEIECQTEVVDDISKGIKISEKLNSILILYAKNMILHNPVRGYESENENIIKKRIYEWSKEYFRKLLDENEVNKNIKEDIKCDLISTHTDSNAIKDKIKKEIERVNFNIKND
ncbi:conserved Plasmodium protein, unknown function [Plasmodium gallinaceum]|uniref:Uncharacterized protein n=1 Tax=Plasmodium gallinaceum TaxID=5849 RepID=A0A1J1GNJ1_PLAGA|nr:conserved Plasmodium protein, unknown function [Plasmodium gallinaceum]CRG93846.1 conserved Plasmodium protein, unknown function [Plasmodium gallinaceum]